MMTQLIVVNGEVEIIHGIYNKFGGAIIIKTKRKIIGVLLEPSTAVNRATPVTIQCAIEEMKKLKAEYYREVNIDNKSFDKLIEQEKLKEIVRAI